MTNLEGSLRMHTSESDKQHLMKIRRAAKLRHYIKEDQMYGSLQIIYKMMKIFLSCKRLVKKKGIDYNDTEN